MKRKIQRAILNIWRTSAFYIGCTMVVGGFLIYRLGTLVPGLSTVELAARASASSGKLIIKNPLNLPHKLIQYGFISLGLTGAFWMRLASVIFGAIIIIGFYRIVRTWYSVRVALLTSFLLLSSPMFLHYARLGTPQILLAGTIGLFWAGIRMRANEPRTSTIIIAFAIVLNCLYVPGLIWFIIPLLVWQRKRILSEIHKIPKKFISLVVFATIICVAPLLYAFFRDVSLIRTWLAIPSKLSVMTMLSNTWHLPLWLIIRGPQNAVYWLGHAPMMNIFTLVMFVLGIFSASHYFLLDRVKAIFGMIAIGVALTILNGPWELIVVVPIVFVLVASGIALLLQQWFTVFPKNPLARWVGIGTVLGIILLASIYNVRHYYIAWPHALETRQTFSVQQR